MKLSLGIDPSIKVTYSKPTVRRSVSGPVNKEDAAIFRRVCHFHNTKNVGVPIILMEQVPLTDGDRLRVSIIEPPGLHKPGNAVVRTTPGYGNSTLLEDGVVRYEFMLPARTQGTVELEYETRGAGEFEVSEVD